MRKFSISTPASNQEIQFLLYSMPDTDGKVQVVVKYETLWCTQRAMAQLHGSFLR